MATSRPFSYNTGSLIPGTTQSGNIAAGYPTSGFASTGLQWWNGPDEDLGYVIANPKPSNNQPTPDGKSASVGFWRSSALTDNSFISLVQSICKTQSFASTTDAKTWLTNSGYWTSYSVSVNTLNNNLFAAWNFDNSTIDSIGGNTASLILGCTYSTGKINQGLIFDGINDYASLADNSLNLIGDFAISMWVYPTSALPQALLNNLAYTSGSVYKGWQLDLNNLSGGQGYKVTFTIGQGPASSVYTGWEYTTTAMTANAWNHVYLHRVSGVNTYCWVNGITQSYTLRGTGANITLDPTYHTTQYCTIGASKTLAGVGGSYLKANSMIDALTIWNRVLTTAERIELYNSGVGKQYLFT